MWALGLGMGLCSLLPSLWLRQPVMVAWSTPGAAVLATAAAAGDFGMAQATGAFLVSAALIVLSASPAGSSACWGGIPMPLASALLAGVLTRFGLDAFAALKAAPGLVTAMLCTFLIGRRFWPRCAVPGVLAAGILFATLQGRLHPARRGGDPSRWLCDADLAAHQSCPASRRCFWRRSAPMR